MHIVVIGLGSMGRRRIRLLKNCILNIGIIGVDNNQEKIKYAEDNFKINCFLSLDKITSKLDCAFVCTSPQYHGVIIRECLEKGLHVFSEINLIEDLYEENIQLAKMKNRVLFLSSTPLYKSEMQLIEQKIKRSNYVHIYNYHVGQYLTDWHPWDNLKDFFASEKLTNGCRELLAIELPWIEKTFGEIIKVNVIKKNVTKLSLDFSDTYMIQAEHASGDAGSLLIDVASRHAVRELEIISEDMYIRWSGTPDSLYEKDIISGDYKQILIGNYMNEQGYNKFINEYAYLEELKEFFDVISGKKKAMYSFEKDLKILRLIDKIEK